MKSLILLAALLSTLAFSGSVARACLNPIGRLAVGEPIRVEGVAVPDLMKNLTTHQNRAYWEEVREDLKKRTVKGGIWYDRNNLAVALIHLGELGEAISILEQLEREAPGQYYVATNLGTAYELSGKNQEALEWIKKGFSRNEDSHRGTEWLHVKILEAKLALEKDPNRLKDRTVTEIDFGDGSPASVFATDHLGQKKSLAEIETALVYQLHERLEFVKPREAVVADLLADLGKVFALSRTPAHAEAINALALEYRVQPAPQTPSGTPAEVVVENVSSTGYVLYMTLAAMAFLLAGLVFVLFKKRRYR